MRMVPRFRVRDGADREVVGDLMTTIAPRAVGIEVLGVDMKFIFCNPVGAEVVEEAHTVAVAIAAILADAGAGLQPLKDPPHRPMKARPPQ